MEDSQSLGLFNVRLSGLLSEQLPPAAQLFGDLSVVLVRSDLNDLATLQLGPDHEGVHRALDVIWRMLLSLKNEAEEDKFKIRSVRWLSGLAH